MSNGNMSADDVLLTLLDTVIFNTDSEWAKAVRVAVAALIAERDGLRAARIAYASEFDPDAEGMPNVGSIHENIRKLKAERDALREAYHKARNAAAGFSNYCEDSANSRRCERELAEAERMFRGIDAARANEST